MGALVDLGEVGRLDASPTSHPPRAWRVIGYGVLTIALLANGYAAVRVHDEHKPTVAGSPPRDRGAGPGRRAAVGGRIPVGILPPSTIGLVPSGHFACGPLDAVVPAGVLSTAFRVRVRGPEQVHYRLEVLPTLGLAV